MDGLHRVGGVVLLHGAAVRCALEVTVTLMRGRQLDGRPTSRQHRELAQTLADALAASDTGHSDVRPKRLAHHQVQQDITVAEAAKLLNLSPRQVCRLAPRLGGRKSGGQWRLDHQAVTEHAEGTQ